jgi:hypothetical protein
VDAIDQVGVAGTDQTDGARWRGAAKSTIPLKKFPATAKDFAVTGCEFPVLVHREISAKGLSFLTYLISNPAPGRSNRKFASVSREIQGKDTASRIPATARKNSEWPQSRHRKKSRQGMLEAPEVFASA